MPNGKRAPRAPKTRQQTFTPVFYDMPTLSAMLNVGESTCRRLIALKLLRAVRVGARVLVTQAAIDDFVALVEERGQIDIGDVPMATPRPKRGQAA